MRTRDPNSWMWAEALELLQSAERLQRQFFHQVGVLRDAPRWEPPVDLYEHGDRLRLLVALPGVTAAQVEVALAPGMIVIRGERSLPTNSRHAAIHRLEIPYGPFERRVALPTGEFELIERRLDHGCLLLELRRLT